MEVMERGAGPDDDALWRVALVERVHQVHGYCRHLCSSVELHRDGVWLPAAVGLPKRLQLQSCENTGALV